MPVWNPNNVKQKKGLKKIIDKPHGPDNILDFNSDVQYKKKVL